MIYRATSRLRLGYTFESWLRLDLRSRLGFQSALMLGLGLGLYSNYGRVIFRVRVIFMVRVRGSGRLE